MLFPILVQQSIRPIAIAALILCVSCTRPYVKESTPGAQWYASQSDTVAYCVSFATPLQRQTFVETFEDFLKRYPFDSVRRGTGTNFYRLEVVPVMATVPLVAGQTAPAMAQPSTVQSIPAPTPVEFAQSVAAVASDSAVLARVLAGGTCTIYAPRGQNEFLVRTLLGVAPLKTSDSDSCAPIRSLQQSTASTMMLTIDTGLINSAGQKISGFEYAEAINGLVRETPAQGRALFGTIKGVDGLINGSEAVISGIAIKNAATLQITLQAAMVDNVPLFSSMRAVPPALGLGRYYIKDSRPDALILLGNQHFRGMRPLLEKITVKRTVDNNPFVSFSLNRYDILVLWRADDCDYARRNLSASATLIPYDEDRYFVRLAGDSLTRVGLSGIINRDEIMSSSIKADVRPIDRIESDQIGGAAATRFATGARLNGTIIYDDGDAASRSIAEKIALSATRSGHTLTARGLNGMALERALLNHTYAVCVGYINGDVLTDRSEQNYLAARWFDGTTDEAQRIASVQQVALCAVKRYLLCKKKVAFFNEQLQGIYIQKSGE